MKEKLLRTVLSLAVVLAAVFAVRWTIRSAVARAYRADRDVAPPAMPFVPAPRVYALDELVPEELHANIAGIAIRRRAERLGMPYDLAVELAEGKAESAGWERLDDENALTFRNLSGMERVYKTPEGSIVLREVRAIRGDDSLMEDLIIPVEMVPAPDEQTTPDVLARRSARHVKDSMPDVVRGVVLGSPLMTQLVERNGGAAFLVHCVAEIPAKDAAAAVEGAAIKAGWTRDPNPPGAPAGLGIPVSGWTKGNLTLHFEVVPRPEGGCDLDYRFADDEVRIPRKEPNDEN